MVDVVPNPDMPAPADLDIYVGDRLVAISSVFLVSCTISTAARFISRRLVKKDSTWGLDDLLIIPSYVLCVGLCAIGYVSVYSANEGYHIDAAEYRNISSIVIWGKITFALELVYIAACTTTKLSILALYRRVFTVRWAQITNDILIGLVIITWISETIAIALQCIPITSFWDPRIPGKCVNIILFFKLTNVTIFVTDLPMFVLPFPILWNLNTSNTKKVGMIFVFICGGIGVVASVVRFVLFNLLNFYPDPTWYGVQLAGWTIIEPCVYLIASCLLSVKPLIQLAASYFQPFSSKLVTRKTTAQTSDADIVLYPVTPKGAKSRGFTTLDG